MLPRSQRLSAKQLDMVMEKGKVVHSPLFLIRLSSDNVDTRISAIAPQKIFKTAVSRGEARRRVYNAIREMKKPLKQGLHIALIAKAGVPSATREGIVKDLEAAFVKMGIVR